MFGARAWALTLGLLLAAAAVVGCWAIASRGSEGPSTLVDRFDGRSGFRINERSSPGDDDVWRVTSGSLFQRDAHGWTGPPDRSRPDETSAAHTNSAVFRMVSKERSFGDVDFSGRFLLRDLGDRATRDYDGVHLFLRYRSPDELYVVTIARRDQSVTIKRKLPTQDGEDYTTLADRSLDAADDGWVRARVSAVNVADGVRLRLWLDGAQVLDVTDRHPGALTGDGAVGVRADNVDAVFDDLVAAPVRPIRD